MTRLIAVLLFATSTLAGPARAEVVDFSASGFTVKSTAEIAAAPGAVYDAIAVTRIRSSAPTLSLPNP